ncbi:MAG: hypothetical protein IJK89_13115 [Clostridia bacterium]|nr:hypothetical protein [Clostridia bacterium]
MANDDVRSGNGPDGRPQDETVDDILAGILNGDGSFNEEFGELMDKYLGPDAAHVASLRGVDLSNRTDEPRIRQRVEYEDPAARYPYERAPYDRGIDRRIEERMPENVRYMYNEAAASAQRPEFTSSGNVRYPAMGVGAAEERVVYDAEWEERARQEAARLQRVREDRMLRGDSTYVRSFVANGRTMRPGRSPFIDPLSADDDFDDPYRYERNRQDDRKSFFQEGPPVTQARNRANRQRNTGNAGGRTNRRPMNGGYDPDDEAFESFSDAYEREQAAKAAWLQPDEENASGKKRKTGQRRSQKPQMTTTLRDDYDAMSALREGEGGRPVRQPPAEPETLTQPPRARRQNAEKPAEPPAEKKKPEPAAPEELAQAEQEAQGLRSTVAEIVDKYNKRSEEEAQAREAAIKAELARQEAARQERERFLQSLPEEISAALKEEDAAAAERYDDFSGASPEFDPIQTDSLREFAAAHAENAAEGVGEEPRPQDAAEDVSPAAAPQDYSVYLDQYDEPD